MGAIRPRQHERVTHLRETSFRVASTGAAGRGYTLDLSPTGVRLFTPRSLAVGAAIDLTWDDRDPPVTLGGLVVYVNVDLEGSAAGVRFFRPLSPGAYRALRGGRRGAAGPAGRENL